MNFTREPIIETVITPREGCKLVVRNSKGSGQEDYFVDAVEVVSFGHSFFFRSLERPKSFLVPVSDYEILELKETRMVLKNASADRSIKIGGGRDQPVRSNAREQLEEAPRPEEPSPTERPEKKRDRRRSRRRTPTTERTDRYEPVTQEESSTPASLSLEEKEEAIEPVVKTAPSFISRLFPPPSKLIKETLIKKEEEAVFPLHVEEVREFGETILEHSVPERDDTPIIQEEITPEE